VYGGLARHPLITKFGFALRTKLLITWENYHSIPRYLDDG
jgi:hypothetical protein